MQADLPTLQALLARVEAATGPDRELDELIHDTFGDLFGRSFDEFRAAMAAGQRMQAAPYTSSVDAVRGLVLRLGYDAEVMPLVQLAELLRALIAERSGEAQP